MASHLVSTFMFIAIFHSVAPADKQTLRAFFTQNIVPDVIDSIPPSLLYVNYVFLEKNGTLNTPEVNLGNVLTQGQAKEQPIRVSLENVNPNKTYAMMMTDVDPPTSALPGLPEFLHWLVVNVPGNETNFANEGDTLVKYYPPAPPPLTGLHRFVFLIFEQPFKHMHFDKRDYPVGTLYSRLRFKRSTFMRKYNLGKPVGANFYTLKYNF